jgi:rubrerythrin
MDKEDYLKKALLDSQERVRDYMEYSRKVDDKRLQSCFRDFAEVEGKHAQRLQNFLAEL